MESTRAIESGDVSSDPHHLHLSQVLDIIIAASGATHLTVKDSSTAGKAIHYATADLFVTRQKDAEPKAADWANTYNVADPPVDFSKFLDGESLDQEDL